MNGRALSALGAVIMIFTLWATISSAADKVKYGVAVGTAPSYTLPVYAAEEKGFWKDQGLEVEWFGFRGGTDAGRAMVGRRIDLLTMETISSVLSVARGIPLIIVASFNERSQFHIWALKDSPLRVPKDLQGARLAVTSMHDLTGSYSKMLKKALGIEFNLVAAGGSLERLALLRARKVEGNIAGLSSVAPLLVKGEIRPLLLVEDYTPKPWNEYHINSSREVAQARPEVVKKIVMALLRASDFVRENPAWTIDQMMTRHRFSREAAQLIYDDSFKEIGGSGRINPKGIENVTNFLVEYGLIPKDKAPAVKDMFTNQFVQ